MSRPLGSGRLIHSWLIRARKARPCRTQIVRTFKAPLSTAPDLAFRCFVNALQDHDRCRKPPAQAVAGRKDKQLQKLTVENNEVASQQLTYGSFHRVAIGEAITGRSLFNKSC